MRLYLKYLKTLLRHKWYVFCECLKEGIPLRGLIHDCSKFLPSEFISYAKYFKGDRQTKPAHYQPYDTKSKKFDFAWLLHQKRNRHHWQWWVLPKDDGKVKVFEMDEKSRLEMICDWRGAGRAYSGLSVVDWYQQNKEKMILAPETRKWVEEKIGII